MAIAHHGYQGAYMTDSTSMIKSDKNATTTLLLCIFLGWLGIHRFYVGKIKTGILMLLTLGGFGIWMLIDLIYISSCNFTDGKNKLLIFTRAKSPLKLTFIVFGCLIAGFLVYFILIFSLVMRLTTPLTNAVDGQLSALRAGDMTAAYAYMADNTKKSISINEFKQYMDKYPAIKSSVSASFPKREFNNNEGYIVAVLTMKDGSKVHVEYQLLKENGIWKISALRIAKDETTE